MRTSRLHKTKLESTMDVLNMVHHSFLVIQFAESQSLLQLTKNL